MLRWWAGFVRKFGGCGVFSEEGVFQLRSERQAEVSNYLAGEKKRAQPRPEGPKTPKKEEVVGYIQETGTQLVAEPQKGKFWSLVWWALHTRVDSLTSYVTLGQFFDFSEGHISTYFIGLLRRFNESKCNSLKKWLAHRTPQMLPTVVIPVVIRAVSISIDRTRVFRALGMSVSILKAKGGKLVYAFNQSFHLTRFYF